MPFVVDLGDTARLTAAERYYVHVIATLGTLAEREVDEVGDAVFGRESESQPPRVAGAAGVSARRCR